MPQTNPHQPLEEPSWLGENDQEGSLDKEKSRPSFVTPMYDHLVSNLPHFLMKHSDDSSLERHPLFARREVVLQYLENYASEIRHLVKFRTQVQNIQPMSHDGKEGWLVRFKDLLSSRVAEDTYDAVVVASGHYSVPYVPAILGIERWNETYPGAIVHSKFFRNPVDFANKKVMIIGDSASGVDLVGQISAVSKLPIVVSIRSMVPHHLTNSTEKRVKMPEVVEFLPASTAARAVRFVDGRVEAGIDRIIFCTGYYFSFPFLSSISPPFIVTGERVENIYKHVFSIYYPTLAFLGLPTKIIPFRTCDGQAAVVARVWSGRLSLPSQSVMRNWEEQRIADRGGGTKFHELKLLEDIAYHNEMVDWAFQARSPEVGKAAQKWSQKDEWTRSNLGAIRKALAKRGEAIEKIRSIDELGFSFEDWLRGKNGRTE